MDYFQKYQKYKAKYLDLKNSSLTKQVGGGEKKKELYLFKDEWCGHCKNFKSTWEEMQNDSSLKKEIKFITMDSDKNQKEIAEWNVEGFPTIILKNDNKATEYNGPRTIDAIKEFINKN